MEITDEQNQYLDDFINELNRVQAFFSKLNLCEECLHRSHVPEIHNAARIFSNRKFVFEKIKRHIKFVKKKEFLVGFSVAYEELIQSINALQNYYDVKIKKLYDIYLMYEKIVLDDNLEALSISLKELRVNLDKFIAFNYFIKELQYRAELKSEYVPLTKTQLIEVSASAEILEIELIKAKKPKKADIEVIFNRFYQCIRGLTDKGTETTEFLIKIANKWISYKEVFQLTENRSIQTTISGEIQPVAVATVESHKETTQKGTPFLGTSCDFFRQSTSDFKPGFVQVPTEESEIKKNK